MQVEPPRPDVPADVDRAEAEPPSALRLTAAVAAAALAISSTGHLFVLGGALILVAATRVGGVAVLLACTAVLVRWGSPSLAAVAGAQAVLGPAVLVGSATAVASTWLASFAIALTARDRLTAGAFGLAAGAVAAGPTFPHAFGTRLLGAAIGVAVAYGAHRLPRTAPAAAVAIAAGALVLAALA